VVAASQGQQGAFQRGPVKAGPDESGVAIPNGVDIAQAAADRPSDTAVVISKGATLKARFESRLLMSGCIPWL
jgi:hypothetical protein